MSATEERPGGSPERAEESADKRGPAEHLRPHRWKPGQSGNPGGRPKGESVTATLRRMLQQEHNGKTIQEILAERVIKEAISGKFQFAKELRDRLEGRPAQKVEVAAAEDLLTFVVPPPRVMTPEEYEASPPPGKVIWGINPDDI